MAYDKEKILKQLIDNIQADDNITTFEDAAITVPPSLRTLYDWKLHELQAIKDAINQNKVQVKNFLRKQWREGNPTLQLALYKLLSTDEERKALQMEYREYSGEVSINKIERKIIDPKNE
jgi:hypothetical protein